MVVLGKVHVGDKGTEFQLEIYDTDIDDNNTLVDLSGVSNIDFIFTDPDGVEKDPVTASIANPPGTDGIASYVNSDTSFIDIPGFWYYRAELTFTVGGNIFTTDDAEFEVLGGIE